MNERDDNFLNPLFSESSLGRFVPRAIFVDTEPSVIDAVKAGPYK